MPMLDFTCPNNHRFEALTKLNPEHYGTMSDERGGPVKGGQAASFAAQPLVKPCPECGADAVVDEVPRFRHLDKLGPDANYCTVRFNFNWQS